MIRNVLSISKYTFISYFRNKLLWIFVLFGLLLLGSSVLFGLLSQEQEIRMLIDLGLAAIEIISFLAAVFLMVNLVLEEIESKTIYLLLTRSVGKSEYLLGKFTGALLAIGACYVLMVLAHAALLFLKGWKPEAEGALYLFSVFTSFEKIVLISALALFFSLFSSSGIAAMIFSLFFWTLGHFALELKYLSAQVASPVQKWLFKAVYTLIPHFQYLNARDLWAAFPDRMGTFVWQGALYTLCYAALALALARTAFGKKEF